jgi:general secretion pathway protein J
MKASRRDRGFTLVEVLIALAITAFVSTIAYTSLSTVITGMERTRENSQRAYAVNRAWHNPNAHPRSNLQRVNYRLEDDALWRDSYPVLDRAGDTEPASVKLLEGVEQLRLEFLGSMNQARGTASSTRQWSESWIADSSQPDTVLPPPAALQLTLQLEDWGELRRLYELPGQ